MQNLTQNPIRSVAFLIFLFLPAMAVIEIIPCYSVPRAFDCY